MVFENLTCIHWFKYMTTYEKGDVIDRPLPVVVLELNDMHMLAYIFFQLFHGLMLSC